MNSQIRMHSGCTYLPLSCFDGGGSASSESGVEWADLAGLSCGIDSVSLLVVAGAAGCCFVVVSDAGASWDGLGLPSELEPAIAVARRRRCCRLPDQA